MVKKIIEDVVVSKKDVHAPTTHKPEPARVMEPTEDLPEAVEEKVAYRKEMHHVEEMLPDEEEEEEIEKEHDIEQSPIFTKMKQRHEERESFSEEYAANKNGRGKWFAVMGVTLGVIALLVVACMSTIFYSASVVLVPKHVKADLNAQEFVAGAPGTEGQLHYQVMKISFEDTVKLTATGEKRVTSKSTGKIMVYNNFGTQAQTLVKNTRFETTDGKIFRIDRQISIPGMKGSTPGSVEATVFADEAGTDYNIGLVDFTIPGFKGSPRYAKFYARSKTAMAGGASGIVKTVSEADRDSARTSLTESIKARLLVDAKAQKPKGAVMYPDAMFFTFTDTVNDSATSAEKDVPFTLKGTLEAVLFNEQELSREIVSTSGETTPVENINIDNIEALAFAWKTIPGGAPKATETVDFTLSGTANAVWEIDIPNFKNKLAGRPDSEYNKVLSLFPGVSKSTKHSINPFWRHSYPTDEEKINVQTVID